MGWKVIEQQSGRDVSYFAAPASEGPADWDQAASYSGPVFSGTEDECGAEAGRLNRARREAERADDVRRMERAWL